MPCRFKNLQSIFVINWYNILCLSTRLFIIRKSRKNQMTTSDIIRKLCNEMIISISELALRIGQSSQNFNKKLLREIVF